MEHVRITSSMIRSAGFDAAAGILEIAYLNGTVYRYFDVPKKIFRELLQAVSAGTYLSTNVIGVFRCNRVYPDQYQNE
jgi:hypothetical protein